MTEETFPLHLPASPLPKITTFATDLLRKGAGARNLMLHLNAENEAFKTVKWYGKPYGKIADDPWSRCPHGLV
ncbi:hypothetical protein D5086_017794 [Populus alba]|uniref:Uncharacterized protein n=1 Tax=Populus alba TaxID=43335 RepID=A0ACC4BN22_POPAL